MRKITPADIFQGNVINNLNQYLRWNNLPLHMNEDGICHGLASVYAKYVLEGKQKKFLQMLNYIAGTPPPKTLESKLNHFVVELVKSFEPNFYNKSINQNRSMQTLFIDGKSLKPSFNLAMVARKNKWADVFNDLQLQENEVLRLSSYNHTVTLTKKAGKYYLYDPNYSSLLKTFSSEKALVQELYAHVFYFSYSLGPAYMFLQVIKNPSDLKERATPFPEKNALYEKYLPVVQPAKVGLLKWLENHSKWYEKHLSTNHKMLSWGATCEDKSLLTYLLQKGVKDNTHESLDIALRANDKESIQTIIQYSKPSTRRLQLRLYSTIFNGLETSFEAISNELGPDALKNLLEQITPNAAFKAAARGGSLLLLKKIMGGYSASFIVSPKPLPPSSRGSSAGSSNLGTSLYPAHKARDVADVVLAETMNEAGYPLYLDARRLATEIISGDKDAIYYAIKSRSSECAHLLLSAVYDGHGKIDDKKMLQYIVKAIQGNQPHMVSLLLERASDALVSTLTLSPKAVERTDLAILSELKRKGVAFSPLANAMLNIKEHRPIGFLLSIGITLYKFTDFLAFLRSKKSGVTYSAEKFGLFQAAKAAKDLAPIPIMNLDDFLKGKPNKKNTQELLNATPEGPIRTP